MKNCPDYYLSIGCLKGCLSKCYFAEKLKIKSFETILLEKLQVIEKKNRGYLISHLESFIAKIHGSLELIFFTREKRGPKFQRKHRRGFRFFFLLEKTLGQISLFKG